MKCFEHHESEAIGSCISCGRGLCERCHRLTESSELVCGDDCRRRAAVRDLPRQLFVEEMTAKTQEYRFLTNLFIWVSRLLAVLTVIELVGLCLIWKNVNLNQIGIPIWWLGNSDIRLAIFAGVAAVIFAVGGRRCRAFSCQYAEKAFRFRVASKPADA